MDEPKRITIDELRSLEGLDHLTDEEATEIIDSLEVFAEILIEHFRIIK